MRKYELTYLVSDEVPENDLNKVTGKVTGFVNELGGKLTKEDIWGRRKLAYPIKKQDFATYITLYFDLPSNKVFEFERDLRHIEGVVRHLMIVKDLGDEAITLTKEDIAAAEEIQDVVGGERSFEAIEGETEESRDLMAKREETEEPVIEEAKEEPADSVSSTADAEKENVEVKEEPKAKKVTKKAEIKEEEPVVEVKEEEEATEVKEEKKEETEAPAKPKKVAKKKEESTSAKAPADKKVNDEVERLSKLNEELDDILKDEL